MSWTWGGGDLGGLGRLPDHCNQGGGTGRKCLLFLSELASPTSPFQVPLGQAIPLPHFPHHLFPGLRVSNLAISPPHICFQTRPTHLGTIPFSSSLWGPEVDIKGPEQSHMGRTLSAVAQLPSPESASTFHLSGIIHLKQTNKKQKTLGGGGARL